ncbi:MULTISPECIES: hypothetical protein [unclassified Rhizobium]|uniref:hypothetical protein n=1 Tax=unclassified Rhizobium TaxID=2613769 RepID=UPI0025F5907C|nr:hypothetical protein [Rhizobium sp. UBA1881]
MWEVVILAGLARHGNLNHEVELQTGKRPDIHFDDGKISFTADITCVSDRGLNDRNPYWELMDLLTAAQRKLRLPAGGLDLRVLSTEEWDNGTRRTSLRLPPRKRLQEFVQAQIIPELRTQIKAGVNPLRIAINDDHLGVEITINTAGAQFTTGGFSPYTTPTLIDDNPLYKALREKAKKQLRGIEGFSGIIVGDGDCTALSCDHLGSKFFRPEEIAANVLRQYSSLDFVLMIAIQDVNVGNVSRPVSKPMLVTRHDDQMRKDLIVVFNKMLSELPIAVNTAVNGARRAMEVEYELGNHGGYRVEGDKITISARELMEVLAGARTFDDHDFKAAPDDGQKGAIRQFFAIALAEGRLPAKMSVLPSTDDDNDSWVEFEFGEPDAAITPFR